MTRIALAAAVFATLLAPAASTSSWSEIAHARAADPAIVLAASQPAPEPPTRAPSSGSLVAPLGPPLVAPQAPTAVPQSGDGVLRGVSAAASGVVHSAANGINALSAKVHEAIYETRYMLGTNKVPVPRQPIDDPIPALAAVPDSAATDAAHEAAEPPAPAKVAERALPAPAAAQAPVASAAPADAAAVDAGLLANFVYDRGARRPDGSFFVPKPLQRLFDVRTAAVSAADVPLTLNLAGRIVPDPNAHGKVEASLLGRIEPPQGGLPVMGDVVRKGQILAYVEPSVGVVDRSQLRREVAQLTTAIRVETENLEILKQFTFVPFRDGKIYQAEQHLAGLRREREALLPMLRVRESLAAPTDGVISLSTAIPGRITHPGEMVFDIVNPKLLWIEASAPDPVTAEAAAHVVAASALTPEGQTLGVSFVGSGLAVQQQSTPLLFRIENPPDGLRVGRPVTVSVQSDKRSIRGIVLRRDAITVGSDGVQEVWEQTEPEVFLPHPVRTQSHDGQTVLVVDGLTDGAHVVVRGVRLMAQLQ